MAYLSDILFILKLRDNYNSATDYTNSLSTGLSNSCSFIDTMLKNNNNVLSNIEIVNDNNDIDSVVTLHKPRIVIIEALWVVPEKFKVLTRLHSDVNWVVRLHSELPFLANEGIAIQWINQYLTYPNVYVAANSNIIFEELQHYVRSYKKGYNKKLVYLPNHYDLKESFYYYKKEKDWIDVSCFGAIRPLKNHMIQALAALKFANKIGKNLRFHINSERTEQKGDSILKNLISFFDGLKDQGHELVRYEWKTYEEFLKLCRSMDIGMQCSFSETFNIVAADHINMGVPVVTTDEIPWACSLFTANATNSDDICKKLRRAYKWADYNVYFNKRNIEKYNEESEEYWLKFLLH